jgi:hypothetical protein
LNIGEIVIQKLIHQIENKDIHDLIRAQVPESRTLDYKERLPGPEKREFLYDVSSFANAAGGDIVFGVSDKRDENNKAMSIPDRADGLNTSNVQSEIDSLENLLRNGISPRIPGISWQPVAGFTNGPVLVLRIPKSLIGPHMVTLDGASRFYGRDSTGKHPMDVGQIRSAFAASSSVGETLRRFRLERIAKAIEDDLPVPLGEGPKMLLHLIPQSALDSGDIRDVTGDAAKLYLKLSPLSTSNGWQRRYNLDGMLSTVEFVRSYLQVFRSGAIEDGEGDMFKYSVPSKKISAPLEEIIVNGLPRLLEVQRQMDLPLPVFVMVTLLGVKGFSMNTNARFFNISERAIDRDIVSLPEAVIQDYGVDVRTALRPTFDALWQACGFERSLNYDERGKWVSR